MYTRCPGCWAPYSISVEQLRAARGQVLCENCGIAFNALNSLANSVEEAVPDAAAPSTPPVLGLRQALPSSHHGQAILAGLPTLSAPPAGSVDHYLDAWDNAQVTLRNASRPRRVAWGLGTLSLSAILAVQIGVFEGKQLVQNEQLRPWLELACEGLDCSLPKFQDSRQIQIIDRALHPAADDIDGFEFTVVLANRARLPQTFPAIKLVLTELNGQPVAERVFRPEEYLDDDPVGLMPVGEPREILIFLAKPSREVVGFKFELI